MQSLDEKREIGHILEDFKSALPKYTIHDPLAKKSVSKAFKNIYNVLISRREESTYMDEIVAQHFLELAHQYNEKEFAISAEELADSYQNLQNQLHPEPEIEPEAKTVFDEVINSVYTYLFAGILVGAGIGLSLFFLLAVPVVASVLIGAVVGGLIGLSLYSSFVHENSNTPKDTFDKLEKNPYSVWNSELSKSVNETYEELKHSAFFLNNK